MNVTAGRGAPRPGAQGVPVQGDKVPGGGCPGGETRPGGHKNRGKRSVAGRSVASSLCDSGGGHEVQCEETRKAGPKRVPQSRRPSISPSSFAPHAPTTYPGARAGPRAACCLHGHTTNGPLDAQGRKSPPGTRGRLAGSFLATSTQTNTSGPTLSCREQAHLV